jgi:hypothetical protein
MANKTPPTTKASTPIEPKPKAAKKNGKPAAPAKEGKTPKRAAAASAPTDGAPTLPTEAELESLEKYPDIATADITHFHKANEGYQVVAQVTLTECQELGSQLAVPGLSLDVLVQALATRAALAPIERKLKPYYERAYYNRLKADSDAIGVLYMIARFVKSSRNPSLTKRLQTLMDWVAATHAHKKPPAKKPTTKTTGAPSNGSSKA